MESKLRWYFELVERRSELAALLVHELNESQRSMARLDVPEIEQQLARAEGLCLELRSLRRDICGVESEVLAFLRSDPLVTEEILHWRAVQQQSKAALTALVQVTRVHAALLRRSRRSVNVLMNVLSNRSAPYISPGARSFQPLGLGV